MPQLLKEHEHDLEFHHIYNDAVLYGCKDKECKVTIVKSANDHACEWEFAGCKDGETHYTCKVPNCKETKEENHDAGCGG